MKKSVLPFPSNLLLPDQRRIFAGKSLNGGVFLEIEGAGRMELSRPMTIEIAKGLLKAVDIDLEISSE